MLKGYLIFNQQAVATLLEAELTGAQLSQHLMQLLVDSCGLDYVVTEEVASNVYEHIQLAADLEDLYENDNHESILQRQDIDLRSFFRNLFKAAQDSQLIEGEWYIDGYNFLRLILESDSVPADSVLKVSCAYLNALFLIPLSTTYVYIFKKNNETDNFKGILSVLAKIIKYIFSHIQKGFR